MDKPTLQGVCALQRVQMTHSAGQGVGSVGLGWRAQAQQNTHHVLDLFLGGPARADDRALDLQCAVLRDREPPVDRGADGSAAGMTEHERGTRIVSDKDLLNRQSFGPVRVDDFEEAFMYETQPLRQLAFTGAYAAAGDVLQTPF